MVPPVEPFFPPLDKVLSREQPLISWSESFIRINDKHTLLEDDRVYLFLQSPSAIRSIASATSETPPSSQSTKSDYETRTAAINITPTSHGQYNIEQIKSDTEWLSIQLRLDEVTALRIVLLEWQHRPVARLRCGFTEAEVASLESVIGRAVTRLQGAAEQQLSFIKARTSPEGGLEHYLSDESRRMRILDEYFEWRKYRVAVQEFLVATVLERTRGDSDLYNLPDQPTENMFVLEALGRRILQDQIAGSTTRNINNHIERYITALEQRIKALTAGSGLFRDAGGRAEIEDAWTRVNLEEMQSIMNILLLHLRASKKMFPSSTVLAWLRLVSKWEFFESFDSTSEAQASLIPGVRYNAAAVSLAILRISDVIGLLSDMTHRSRSNAEPAMAGVYFLDRTNFAEIHDLLITAADARLSVASPAVLAWGIVLAAIRQLAKWSKDVRESGQLNKGLEPTPPSTVQSSRRDSNSSLGSFQQSIYEDLLDAIRHVNQADEPVDILVGSAVDGSNVFGFISDAAASLETVDTSTKCEILLGYQELISSSLDLVGYSPEVLSCVIELLRASGPRTSISYNVVASAFVHDDILMTGIFEEALSRFPYEMPPLLHLCAALASFRDGGGIPFVLSKLGSMDTCTQSLQADFQAYHTIREDENNNYVELDQGLNIHGELQSHALEPFTIQAGTIGQVISESRPVVIMWNYHYSALAFLGSMLDCVRRGEQTVLADGDSSSGTVIAATITLLTKLMDSSLAGSEGRPGASSSTEGAKGVLEEASDALDRNEDIVALIFDLFEQELQSLRYRSAANRSLDVLVACMDFFRAILQILPGRIWPLLARSVLVNVDGQGGILSSIIASLEAATGQFPFLVGSVKFYNALISESVSISPSPSPGSQSLSQSSTKPSLTSTSPVHVISRILRSLTQTILEIYESMADWRFIIPQQQAEANTEIASAFAKLLRFAYSADDSPNLSGKATAAVSLAAPYLMEVLSSNPFGGAAANPLLRVLSSMELPDAYIDAAMFVARADEKEANIRLAIDTIRVGRFREKPLVEFETQVFHFMPILVRLVTEHHNLIEPSLTLINVLLEGGRSATSPSQLLGLIGPETSQNLLSQLSSFSGPERNLGVFRATWTLLGTLVSSRQQWFAVMILTGELPKETLKATSNGPSNEENRRSNSFLNSALHLLCQIDKIPPQIGLSLLEFLVHAQENWSWTTASLQDQSDFLPSLYSYVSKIEPASNQDLLQCDRLQIASKIADVLTIFYHHMRTARDQSFLKKAVPALKWFAGNATSLDGYRSSLHTNLSRNLKKKYPTCQLSNFKRTLVSPNLLGKGYYYDIDLAKLVLAQDPTWLGDTGSGFEHEAIRANINLSLVEAQLRLLQSWKSLAVEHSMMFLRDPELQKPMADAAKECLLANNSVYPPGAIFDEILQVRADFALAIMQRMIAAKTAATETQDLLASAWAILQSHGVHFNAALGKDDIPYWRTLTNVVFLALQFHQTAKPSNDENQTRSSSLKSNTLSIILEILSSLVAPSFREMTSVLHAQDDSSGLVTPKDFSLLLGIVHTCLSMPSLPRISAEVSEHIIANDVAKSAMLLYSWSHVLTVTAGNADDPDPVYGEISSLFLVSLSTFPLLAEHLATSSVLAQLSATDLSQILVRSRGVSPFDARSAFSRRLFSIWSAGLLPLCLNLLTLVGREYAGEIAAFLNQFPMQLERASVSFATSSSGVAKDGISLSMANECANLALISHIINAYRVAGPSAGVDAREIPVLKSWEDMNRKELREDLEDLIQKRSVLRRRIMPCNEKESEMARSKATKTGEGHESILEQTIVDELKSAILCLKGNSDGPP